jgi:hypothetical protein
VRKNRKYDDKRDEMENLIGLFDIRLQDDQAEGTPNLAVRTTRRLSIHAIEANCPPRQSIRRKPSADFPLAAAEKSIGRPQEIGNSL